MTSSSPPIDQRTPRTPGLRERKKAQTRAAIQRHALRLFREHSYGATTMEQIAEAADISPSTLYRYFPTKEDLVLADDYDALLAAAYRLQPPEMSPLEALRAAITGTLTGVPDEDAAEIYERTWMSLTIPEVRAKAVDHFVDTANTLAELISERSGAAPGDFATHVTAGTVVGAMLGAHLYWTAHPDADLFQLLDQAMAQLIGQAGSGSATASETATA